MENQVKTKKRSKVKIKKKLPDQKVARIRVLGEIVKTLVECHKSSKPIKLPKIKSRICKKYGLQKEPKLLELIPLIPEEYRSFILPHIKVKPVRTASGIAVIAVMSKPHRCPHIVLTGTTCVYCPGGMDSDFEYSSQSYTGFEPTSMRAIRSRYNPYLQVRDRLTQLRRLGHDVDKVEFIIMGGTFMSLPQSYRHYFIRSLHDGLTGHFSSSVEESIVYSQESPVRCIGITIETRPDYCLPRHLKDMLQYGTTRLEVGVQSVYEDITRDTNRGHTVEDVKKCFRYSKECGFKMIAHMMPDLPKSDFERDIFGFLEFFENPGFRPDGLKLYPTLVIRGTGLYELYRSGEYKNYPPEILIALVAKILSFLPPWVRVYRIQRDIPMPLVTSGVEKGNVREIAMERVRDMGVRCKDIRWREVGIRHIHLKIRPDEVELVRRDYMASGGWETFLAYEDPKNDILIGLLRLRKLEEEGVSMIRELHVYGSVVPVSHKDPKKFQHRGYGTLLMEEAERIAREEHGSTKISVISGVGVRKYYFKLGYYLDSPYCSKSLV